MKRFNVEVEGIVPILFNRFTEEAQEGLDKGTQGKKKTKEERIAEAYTKVYRKPPVKGDLGIPAENIKKCMLIGCTLAGIKIGRRSAVAYIRPVVHLETEFVFFEPKRKEPDGIHECTGRIPPKTGARAMIRRPYLDTGWVLKFSLYISDERVPPEIVEQSIKEGGLLAGFCDHRPEFGRFKLNAFTEA